MRSFIKPLASLKIAVFIILSFAILTAIGTFIEAKYDATAASKLVYRTPWMFAIMAILAINLIAVMVDRWPWKKRHTPFILAHIGILILLLGSWITFQFGLDGTIRVGINDKNRFVTIPETDLIVWSSFDGVGYTKLFDNNVDFFTDSPAKNPIEINLDAGKKLKILDYKPYSLGSPKVVSSQNVNAGSGLRFQLVNAQVQFAEWLVQRKIGETAKISLGPATVVFGDIPALKDLPNENIVYLTPLPTYSEKQLADPEVRYAIFSKDNKHKPMKGLVAEGKSVITPWMGLELKILRFMPKAEQIWDFKFLEQPTPLTTAAIKINFDGKEQWAQQNDVVKLFGDQVAYILSYGNRRIDMGFDIFLKKFEVGRYEGTMRAASYQSLVSVAGIGDHLISMNEPLKHNGLTIYQASFQDGPDGMPVASIFSVNHDPGRWIKYLGSLILSLGVIVLFWQKRKSSRAQAPLRPEEVTG
jgi:energy-coupling factor transporter transmembrane protein EcfT